MKTAACASLLLAVAAVAAAWSIHEGWPAAFGRGFLPSALQLHGDRHHVAREFALWRGTAIAPPLALLVALAILAALAARGSRLALVGLVLIGAVGFVGYWGEPMVRSILWGSAFTVARAALVAASLALCALMTVVGIVELRERRAPALGGESTA